MPHKKREDLGEQRQSVCAEAVRLANKPGNEEKRSILCVSYINENSITSETVREY